ncbi:hypothetical protein MASR1M90_12550 [Desulfovibrionales bacterium]
MQSKFGEVVIHGRGNGLGNGRHNDGLCKHSYWRICRIFLLCWLCAAFGVPYSWAGTGPVRILVLHSYHQGNYWTDGLQQAIAQRFAASGLDVDLDIHYLDMARSNTAEKREKNTALFVRHLTEMPHNHEQCALVLTTDNEALDVALTYRDQIAPNAPLVFCGVNDFSPNFLLGYTDVTGVVEQPSFADTIALARKLRPHMRKVLVLAENTLTGLLNQYTLLRQRAGFPPDVQVDVIHSTDITKLERRLSALTQEWIVLALSRPFDGQRLLPIAEAAQRISQAAPVPVFTGWDVSMGYGYLGGVLVSAQAQASAAVDMAVRVLRGEDISTMPVQATSPNVTMVDELVAKRFGIPFSAIPENATVLHHEPSFYEEYRHLVWFYGLIILGFTALVLALGATVLRRNKAEAALRRQLAFTETLLQTVPVPVFYKDMDDHFLGCNDAYVRFYGLDSGDVRGKAVRDVFPEAQAEIFYHQDMGLFASNQPQRYEYSTQTPAGMREVVVYKTLFFDQGQRAGILGIIVDVSQLVQTEERLRLAIEASATGIWEWNRLTDEVYYSPRWKEIIGYEHDDRKFTIDDWKERIHPEDREWVLHVNDHFFQSEDSRFELEYRLRHKDGTYRWIGAFAVCLRDADGNPYRVTGSHTDITARKELEHELRSARDAALAASEAKSTFLANMSHEIRTPLNGILGMLQLLQPLVGDEEQREYIRLALVSSQRLTSLLTDILDFSRIESGQMALEAQPFAVDELRDALLGLFRITAQEKGLALRMDTDPNLPPVLVGDQSRVQQVLFNLVGNALKFTAQGGVHVYACLLPVRQTDRYQVYFEVQDSGCGIPEDRLSAVFEPFVQAEGTYVRAHQGVGLGLSIVRRLIDLMRGSLCIETGPDGTTIGLSLPFGCQADPAPGAVESENTAGLAQTKPLKILLAEDDEVNLFAAKSLLRRLGHQVVVARNGQEAVSLAQTQDFDLVFMDIQMPVMDGVEATKAIRALSGPRAHVPIIAMTAYAMAGDEDHFLDSGMTGYVPKPVNMRALELVLKQVWTDAKNGLASA